MVERCCSTRSRTRSSTCGQMIRCRSGSSPPRRSRRGPVQPPAGPRGRSRWPSVPAGRRGGPAISVMSSTGTTTLQLEPLLARRLHHRDLAARRPGSPRPPRPAGPWPTARSAGRAARRVRLGAAIRERVQALQRHREMGAARAARQRVHLVDDDPLHAPEGLPRLGREQQEQRFRRGDQHVRRFAGQLPPLIRGGVARPHRDVDVRLLQPRGSAPRAGYRSAGHAGSARCRSPAPGSGRYTEPGTAACGSAGEGVAASRSSAHRNAASVLPEPVGAMTSVSSPLPIAAHA